MQITLHFFASLREQLGMTEYHIDLPDHVNTVDQLRTHLAAQAEPFASAFAAGVQLRAAVDQVLVQGAQAGGTAIKPGAHVAFFPPVTGG